ncbi:DJ-1/PfpI family protein [Legionella beliardensis]|uniref:DJ-1/PfpI family protein n=1 Tax=Legionella beliardensis TaxID=91822 RepID=UPI000E1C3947|nr:DJ-1/PfpI family protein [Legionella beliardensis]
MQLVFLFYDGMTALDAIGPHEVLSRVPGIEVKRVAQTKGVINTYAADLKLIADYSLAEVTHADILLVPGAGNATSLTQFPDILDWVKQIHATTTWTTSVCTGSLILGAAGILTGLNATSHWAVLNQLQTWGAKPTSQRIVEAGKIITAAGVSAGIDMALSLAAKIADEKTAQGLELRLEYDPKPPFNTGSPEKAPPDLVEQIRKPFSKR